MGHNLLFLSGQRYSKNKKNAIKKDSKIIRKES